jgi:hypothetical protein
MEGKLKEQDDFRRDDFKDDKHFVWKINPLSFMRETSLKPVSVVNEIDNNSAAPDSKIDNQPLPTVNQSNNIKTESQNAVNHAGNNPPPSVNTFVALQI